jgi:hypothetical protein
MRGRNSFLMHKSTSSALTSLIPGEDCQLALSAENQNAEVPKILFHDLRRTPVTNIDRSGANREGSHGDRGNTKRCGQ